MVDIIADVAKNVVCRGFRSEVLAQQGHFLDKKQLYADSRGFDLQEFMEHTRNITLANLELKAQGKQSLKF